MKSWKIGIAVVFGLAVGRERQAAIQTGQTVTLDRGTVSGAGQTAGNIDVYSPGNPIKTYGSGPGGEFRITSADGVQVSDVYCQKNEYVTLSGQYSVTLNDRAIRGGVDQDAQYPGDVNGNTASEPYTYTGQHNTTGDPISEATKWLYNTYLNNDLDGEVAGYVYDDNTSANALQNAIWFLEDEQADGAVGSLARAIADKAIAAVSAIGYARVGYDVLALNLWTTKVGDTYSGLAQSQLYRISTTGTEQVPEPATMLVWGGLAAIGCVIVRRQRRSQVS